MKAGAASQSAPVPPDDVPDESDGVTQESADSASAMQHDVDDASETDIAESEATDSESDHGMAVVSKGLSAGATYAPQMQSRDQEPPETDTTTQSREPRPDPQPYERAPFVPRDALNIQPGDFIRYVKEDGIIYQGEVQHGTPVENDFSPYPGQEEDRVVKLDFEDGKHVAPVRIQQESQMQVRIAEGRTAQGRNVETVSPDEIIAVSPQHEYDWYRVTEAWDEDAEELTIDTDS